MIFLKLFLVITAFTLGACRGPPRNNDEIDNDIVLYIDGNWVKEFSVIFFGCNRFHTTAANVSMTRFHRMFDCRNPQRYFMNVYAISSGVVLPYILDPNFEKYLPIIPPQISSVNFTWKAGDKKTYYYDFDELKSFDESILSDPLISIETKGKVPRKPRVFQVFLPCHQNISGVASFGVGLRIQNDRGLYIPGMPLRLRLQKHCADDPDPECHKKCANGGRCNNEGKCECPKGYMGKYCESALCYPKCMNGGVCTAPGTCSCAEGYIGPHCEGGMCRQKCLHGGKCIQKDTCACRRGYFGKRCEYSKCVAVPCLNGGRCVGINRCRCRRGFTGNQCETIAENLTSANNEGCKKKCMNGYCHNKRCACDKGWFGKRCNRRKEKRRRQRKLYQ